ncbi:MAG: heavy-metal-associated domain-containing protein [Cytophagales bacterium]|nr:MAG: heavy-metal-associated domain-containing protein [Cytophagales bacterium]
MKTKLTALFSALLISFGLMAMTVADDKEVKIKTSAVCEMCKERIERNLSFEKGVKEAVLDVDTKVVTVKFNPSKTDVNKIKANINKTGYDADEAIADADGYKKLPSCCKKGAHSHKD